MSESSSEPTSSQLDDIELAESRTKTYEHQTDVGLLFGKEKQQWSLPGVAARESPQDVSSSMKDEGDFHLISTPAVESSTQQQAPSHMEALEARLTHDSGAVSGTGPAGPHVFRGDRQGYGEASDVGFVPAPNGSRGSTVTVDVLSAAFTLNEHTWQQGYQIGKSPADIICQRTCTGLGVDHGSLRYYELRQVPASQLQPDGHYAVAVDRSGACLPKLAYIT